MTTSIPHFSAEGLDERVVLHVDLVGDCDLRDQQSEPARFVPLVDGLVWAGYDETGQKLLALTVRIKRPLASAAQDPNLVRLLSDKLGPQLYSKVCAELSQFVATLDQLASLLRVA